MRVKNLMECKEVKALLNRYQDNELSPPVREKVCTHLQYCTSCQKDFLKLVEVTVRLKHSPEVETGPFFTGQVMGKILDKEKQLQKSHWWARIALPASIRLSRLVYSLVIIIFLLLGVLSSNGSFKNLNNESPVNHPQETSLVKLLTESQGLSLVNVQDKSLALLVNGKGSHYE